VADGCQVSRTAPPLRTAQQLATTHRTNAVSPAADGRDAADRNTANGKGGRGFPAPVTILAAVLILVWIAAFFIPSGQYQIDAGGSPIAGSFKFVTSPLTFAGRVQDLLLSPVNGMAGIRDPATGMVGPFNQGILFGSVEVFLFILSIGGFMTVVFATGALDLGIHHLSHRFRERSALLIAVLTLLFGALGSLKGWSDETLGLYAMMVPLVIALGYDRLVTVAVVTVAPFVGAAASTINPFAVGIGASKAGVSIADGIGLRLLLFVLVMAATVVYTLWYAARVKSSPEKSLCGFSAEDAETAQADTRVPEPLTATHAVVIGLVFFTFALLAFSIVPWGAMFGEAVVDPYTEKTIRSPVWWELGWWLPELSALFFVMAIVVGIASRLGEEATAKAFIKGVADFTGPAFLVALARSVSVVMTNTKTIDTVLHAMEGLVAGASSVVFVLLTFLGSLPLSFLVGGGAAGTALTIPVLAPLGDFAGVDRGLVITTWTAAAGWLRLILPTNAILIAGLALAKVDLGQYLRFMAPLMAILLVVIVAVLVIGALV
jgi:uncharacterized ion transporter superfamily protein YfcC